MRRVIYQIGAIETTNYRKAVKLKALMPTTPSKVVLEDIVKETKVDKDRYEKVNKYFTERRLRKVAV